MIVEMQMADGNGDSERRHTSSMVKTILPRAPAVVLVIAKLPTIVSLVMQLQGLTQTQIQTLVLK